MTDPPDDIARYYDHAALDWEQDQVADLNPHYFESRWQSIRTLLEPFVGSACAVELGIGTGPYIDRTARLFGNVIGVDFSAGMLAVLGKKLKTLAVGNVTLLRQDVKRLEGITDQSADVVLAIGLLDNVADADRVFSEVARILRPNGGFIATTSNGLCPWYSIRDRIQGTRHHRTGHYLTEDQVHALSVTAGLQLDASVYWGLVPAHLGSRLLTTSLRLLEAPIQATPLRRYLGGLSFRSIAAA